MSKTWYPMINYEKCTECGMCTAKCTHGVYDREKAPRPVVVFPEGCIEGCTGCGSICPNGAIEYFGDREHSVPVSGCGGGCGSGDENASGYGLRGNDCGGGCGCQGGCYSDGTE